MKGIKKITAVLLSSVLLTASLVGCGSGDSAEEPAAQTTEETEPAESEASAEEAAPETAGESGVTTVTWWGNYGGQKEFLESMVTKFNDTVGKENNIELVFENYGGDYNDVITVAASSEQGPEVCKINNMLAKFANSGWILPLNKLEGGQEILDRFDATELKSTSFTIDGDTYGVPMQYMTYRVLYNKDLFKQAGIVDENGEAKEPKTWQDIYEAAKIITEQGNGSVFGFGGALKWDSYSMNALLPQATSATGVWRGYDFNTQSYNFSAYKPVVDIVQSMYKEGYFFPGAEGLDNDSVRAHFAEGNIGIITGASWDVGVYNTQFIPDFDWGVCEPIALEGEKTYPEGIKSETIVTISKQAEREGKLDAALKVFDFVASEEFLVPAYENSSWIPSAAMQEKATSKPERKGFEQFAKMDKGVVLPEDPTGLLEVEGENYNSVIIQIILGLADSEEALADLDERYNAALEAAKADGLDMSLFEFDGLK